MEMGIIVLYLLGLLAIGCVTAMIAKVLDKKSAANVALWGCVMATLWIFYGGMLVFLHFAGRTTSG